MKKEILLKQLCIAFLICFLLTPTILVPGIMGIRADDILAFFVIFYFVFSRTKTKISVKFPVRAVLICFFGLIMLVSITWGGTFGLPTNILDLTKYIWLTKMAVIYFVFFNYIYLDQYISSSSLQSGVQQARRDYLLTAIVTIATVSACICVLQYINPFGINKYYIPIIAPTQATTLIGGYATPRVVGMIGNPNAQGYLMALSLISAVFLQFKRFSIGLFVKMLIIFIALWMTLSRSSVAIFLIGLILLFIFYKKDKNLIYAKYIFLAVFFIIIFLIITYINSNEALYNLIFWRFEALFNIMEDKSFLARFHGWTVNYEYFLKSPIIGVGPIPRGGEIFGASDNEWLYFLRSYGVVGVIWILLFFFSPFLFFTKNKSEENFSRFSLVVITMTAIYMVPAAILTSSSLNSLLIAILALKDTKLFVLSNSKFDI